MKNLDQALNQIPKSLRTPLIKEYTVIVQNYFEKRWSDTNLKAGRFCEIVYTVVLGVHENKFNNKPIKPKNFVVACKAFEKNKSVPRSFQILIPRMLPPLYEIRNNRDSGHVGGEVDSNSMDANVSFSMVSWIMAELIRHFHNIDAEDAKMLIDKLTEVKIPLVWDSEKVKRILKPEIPKKDQVLLFLMSEGKKVDKEKLRSWIEYSNTTNFRALLNRLHQQRLIEFNKEESTVELLPPGANIVAEVVLKYGG